MSATATAPNTDQETRPWGSWHVLGIGDGFKIKQLHIEPQQRLSLQTHLHRSEHWIVVHGTATCTLGEEHLVVKQGGRVDVPCKQLHRIANDGDSELIIIEVQLGDYLGEDDIVRFEDDYGRGTQRHTDGWP